MLEMTPYFNPNELTVVLALGMHGFIFTRDVHSVVDVLIWSTLKSTKTAHCIQ